MATIEETKLDIPFRGRDGAQLRIRTGGCRLRVAPGDHAGWVAGTYEHPGRAIPLVVDEEDDRVTLDVGRDPLDFLGFTSGVPLLDITLGKARPFELKLEGGAGEHVFHLGGLPLTKLELSVGAGSTEIDFERPNPRVMDEMKASVGAGRLVLRGLANARFEELRVEGGAGQAKLEFSGKPTLPGKVRVATALGAVELSIPRSVAAEVTFDGLVGRPYADDGFTLKGSTYLTQAAQKGKTPLLKIHGSIALGRLELVSTA